MKIFKKFRFVAMLTVLAAITPAAHAESGSLTPNISSLGKYQRVGVVRDINSNDSTITISGNKYYYGSNTKVHTAVSNFATVQSLSNGILVGVNFTTDDEGRRLLYEAWVIKANALIPTPSDH